MSSDQQLNVHTSVAGDPCQNKQTSDIQQCEIECSLDNQIAATNASKSNQCASDNGHSLSENGKLSVVPENVDLDPSAEIIPFGVGNVNNDDEIKRLDGKIQSHDNGDAVHCHNNGVQEVAGPVGISTDNFKNRDDNCSPTFNNEAISASEEHPTEVDRQIPSEAPPQILNLNQSNEQDAEQPQNSSSGTATEDVQESIQLETSTETNLNDNTDPQNVPTETTNEIDESAPVDANEIDEAPNDENDNCSNEYNSNEDSCEFPDTEDFDGSNEVENEEYILDTVVRKPRKERRRIVSVNDDDSDPEMEVERERLMQSPTIEENKLSDVGEVPEETIDIELLIQNEKPGPKSKKISTQKLKELQTRELLRNVVVIPSTRKKKNRRIIDSDDDEENSLPYCVNVDDIGLPDTTEENDNDNETDVLVDSILLNDIDKPESPSIENVDENPSEATTSTDVKNEISVKAEPDDENAPITSQNSGNIKCESLKDLQSKPLEVVVPKLEFPDATKNEMVIVHDSANSADNSNQRCKKEKKDVAAAATIDFPPFPPSSSSSENDDEFIPNDVYFGTPDTSRKGSKAGRGRGRPGQSTSRQTTNSHNVSRPAEKSRATPRRGEPSRREKFIDNRKTSTSASNSSSSESDDEYEKSKARRKKPATITIVQQPLKLYQKVSHPIQTRPVQKPQPVQRQKHRKNDRFYDKSQDIPNAIYFGDVDVPLHVLHAYGGSDSDNDAGVSSILKAGAPKVDLAKSNSIRFSSQVSKERGRTTLPNPLGQLHSEARHQKTTKPYSNSQKARGRPKVTSVSPSNDQSIQMMHKFLKAAGLKKVKLNRLWEGCKSNSERAEKMLELLREKGLQGEPTLSKCRQLKVDYLTKKEIEDLDPNLIIQTEGRTRRSVTRAATKRQYTYDEEEILETRTKLRKVIDSDSDFE